MSFDGDPDHPIIERPFEYEIIEFCYHNDPDDSLAPGRIGQRPSDNPGTGHSRIAVPWADSSL
jgi:hypothetical protein